MVVRALLKGTGKKAAKRPGKKSRKGKAYTLKNTTKARVKIGVEGSRAQLAYRDLAKAAAAGENTKIQRGIRQMHAGIETDGAKLKEGLLAMADRVGVTTEQYNDIMNMSEDVLAKWYETTDLSFEVFFNYEGVTKSNGGYLISDEKRQEVQWFIDEYDKIARTSDRDAFIASFGIDTI